MSELQIPITKPLLDIAEEASVVTALRSGWLTQGEYTFEFERRIADYVGTEYAVATSSGTTALHIALLLEEVGPGDEVIIPSMTFVATANALRHVGAIPVFVDIRSDTYNVDENRIEEAITHNTHAIIAVHQVGLPAEIDAIRAVATRRGLRVIEDAACAIGSRYRGRRIGSMSRLTCFSFHPRKVITTGEGGMLTTDDEAAANLARSLVSHGTSVLDVVRHKSLSPLVEDYPRVGYNYRMTNLQGALGVAQMEKLETILQRRQVLASRYTEAFRTSRGIDPPVIPNHVTPNFQSYLAKVTETSSCPRDLVVKELRARGIASKPGIMAIHLSPPYKEFVRDSLPVTERAVESTIILPLYPQMTEADQDHVIAQLLSLTEGKRWV